MSAYFTGVLLLPSAPMLGTTTAVTTAEGLPLAAIRRRLWSGWSRFEMLDPAATTLLATGAPSGLWGNRYELRGAHGEPLLDLKFSGWTGPTGQGTVTLPTGHSLRTSGTWGARTFSVVDEQGADVAGLHTTSGLFSLRPASLAFEVRLPVLSLVQAIGLAQTIRAAVEAAQAAVAAT
jgi:hypothetical protein